MGNPPYELGVFKPPSLGTTGVGSLLMHQRTNLLAFHYATQVAYDVHVEDVDGKVVVLTHADG